MTVWWLSGKTHSVLMDTGKSHVWLIIYLRIISVHSSILISQARTTVKWCHLKTVALQCHQGTYSIKTDNNTVIGLTQLGMPLCLLRPTRLVRLQSRMVSTFMWLDQQHGQSEICGHGTGWLSWDKQNRCHSKYSVDAIHIPRQSPHQLCKLRNLGVINTDAQYLLSRLSGPWYKSRLGLSKNKSAALVWLADVTFLWRKGLGLQCQSNEGCCYCVHKMTAVTSHNIKVNWVW